MCSSDLREATMVSGFSWLAEKIKIIMKQGIRLIVVKVEIVEILFLIFKLNLEKISCR